MLLFSFLLISINSKTANATQTLTLTLKDSLVNYIYEGSCSYNPRIDWYDLRTYIYNASNYLVIYDSSSECESFFSLDPGNYTITITGRIFSYSSYITQKRQITITEGNDLSYTFTLNGGNLNLTTKDSLDNYIYRSSCSYTPNVYWNSLTTYIYNSSDAQIASTTTSCLTNFYLEPGDYTVSLTGRMNVYGPYLTQSRDITIVDGTDLNYNFTMNGGKLNLTLKDSLGNYIYEGVCNDNPKVDWYDISTRIYNSSNAQIVYDSSSECVDAFYLEPGSYTIKLTGRIFSYSPYITQTRQITITESGVVNYTFTVNGGNLNLTTKDSLDNYIYRSSCSYTPNVYWNSLTTYIYNSSDAQIASTTTSCLTNFYLEPGDYTVSLTGRMNVYGPYLTQSRDITIVDGTDLNYNFTMNGGKLNLTLKDSLGNYIYEGVCNDNPKVDWYDISTRIYNSSNAQIVYDSSSECVDAFYLEPGNYRVNITGRETSTSDLQSQEIPITIINRGDCSMNIDIETGQYTSDCSILINQILCQENNTVWEDCSGIAYNDVLSKIRVNCTFFVANITSVHFKLINIPDNSTFIDDYGTKVGDLWIYDNEDITILDSGDWRLEVECGVQQIGQASSFTIWTVPWGHLLTYLINPTTPQEIRKYGVFSVTAKIKCVGGECGDVKSSLDPTTYQVKNKEVIK